MRYQFAICDDEPSELTYLSQIVKEWSKNASQEIAISTFPSAEAFLFDYEEHKDYDILLLDIEMKAINGVELARRIRSDNPYVQIVFITGYPDFMAEGYEVSALHYLIKPVQKEKLFEVLKRACINLDKTEQALIFRAGSENIRVKLEEIQYAEAFAHTVMLHLSDRLIEVKKSISELEAVLGDGFIRCHRSFIVGLKYISRITKTEVILDNGTLVPLSRNAYQHVNQAFITYYTGGRQ